MALRRRRLVDQPTLVTLDPDAEALAAMSRLEETDDSVPELDPDAVVPDEDAPELPSSVTERLPVADVAKPWGGIIRHVYDIDIEATYQQLNADLTLGDRVTDYGTVLQALDVSSRNAVLAARLVRAAKLEDDRVGGQAQEHEEHLRRHARAELEREKAGLKAKGGAVKAPTIQEVEDRIIAAFPDEVFATRRRRAEMHGALRSMEALEKAWWERCHALRKIAERFLARG
jgi:hypothetical protein